MGIVDEFFDIKESIDADLLAMQVGDFYEFFADDARTVSKDLGLKLSEKSSHGSSYAMAGVPINDLSQYVSTLVKNGYRVAVADQYKENGNHKREVTRIVTPGTLIDETDNELRYLATICIGDKKSGFAVTNLGTGEISVDEVETDNLIDEITVYDPVEIIITSENLNKDIINELNEKLNSYTKATVHIKDEIADYSTCESLVKQNFGSEILESLGISNNKYGIISIGTLIDYLNYTRTDVKSSLTRISPTEDDEYMRIDAQTRYTLEIADTMSRDGGLTLYDVMDHTVTKMGSDELKMILQKPLIDKEKILQRQIVVSGLYNDALTRRSIQDSLEGFPRVRRIGSKCTYGSATPRDLAKIPIAIQKFRELRDTINNTDALSGSYIETEFNSVSESDLNLIEDLVNKSIVQDPPNSIEIGVIKEGYNNKLDKLVEKQKQNEDWLDNQVEIVAEENNINHISLGRNKTDGYYIQVGNSETDKMPMEYDQIKSLKNSKRYKNGEIRDREKEIIRTEEQREELEKEVFESIVTKISDQVSVLQSIGSAISSIDAYQSIATHSIQNSWSKPTINDFGDSIEITNGRHPVVEQDTEFVPNNTDLTDESSFMIVTGPNMAGKSTYLRQVALIVLLAQIGSYVPCDNANIGIMDGIYTRVGSTDEISQGRSTFMVEMSELANILHSATDDSLVILDEVGRGTATQDGQSIAQSTIEYLSKDDNNPTPYTLFATHYHNLTDLSQEISRVKNVHMSVKTDGDGYEFTRNLEEGPADKSYGIKVADMAGIPNQIVDRSEEILSEKEES